MSERGRPQIIADALVLHLGQPDTYSASGESRLTGIVDKAWNAAAALAFSVTDWSFLRATRKLVLRAEPPVNGWRHGFDLPGDRFGPPLMVAQSNAFREPIRHFSIEADTLFCDAPECWALIKAKLDPREWPEDFAQAFAVVLAAQLAVPLMEDRDMQAALMVDAFGRNPDAMQGGRFGRLIAQYKASEPMPGAYGQDPLTQAHGGAGMPLPWHGEW